jgi:hypothetical protein
MNKRLVFLVSLSISAFLIVLPVIRSVNNSAGNHTILAPALISEGDPMPAPIPHKPGVSVLVAEGDPMPAPIPHKPGIA